MKFSVYFIVASAFFLAACSKKNDTSGTTVQVTVSDGITGKVISNAVVNLYADTASVSKGTPNYYQLTDNNGQVKIQVAAASKYYVVAQYNGLLNYFRGLIPIGIFTTQTEIDDSPVQTPTAVVGGVKFKDINGDGAITSADNVPPPAVTVTANTNNTLITTIY